MVCPPLAEDDDEEEPVPLTDEQLEALRELAWSY